MHNDNPCPTNNENETDYFYILSLIFLAIMLGTYVLAYKMVSIGGILISGGIFIFPINYAITDITTEIYGNTATIKLLKYSFICCLLFAIVIPFIALMPPPSNWPHQSSYTYILGNVFRFFIANSIGAVIGISINSYVLAKLKRVMLGKYFWLRSIGASSIGELVTSVIADILAFAGTTSSSGVMRIMLSIFAIKLLYSILLSIPSSLLVTHIKLSSKIKVRNNLQNYNPFVTA